MSGYLRALWLLLFGALLADPAANAFCLGPTDPRIVRLEQLADQDPQAAILAVQGALTAVAGRASSSDYVAWLYATEASAYSELMLRGQAARVVEAGLALVPSLRQPAHVELLSIADGDLDDRTAISQAMAQVRAAREAQPRGSVAEICLMLTAGYLDRLDDRLDLAVAALSEAYRSSASQGYEKQHVLAAYALSAVMSEEGHYERALAMLDLVLSHGSADMSARQETSAYQLRAQAHAALKQYRAAYADLDEYARRDTTERAAERDRNTALQSTLFEAGGHVGRSAKLQLELEYWYDRERQQGERNTVLLITGGTFLVLLMYVAIASLRHRDAMELLANSDVLTGLSNRRSIVDCAAAMLATSRDTDTSLTLCLLDLDRFKTINDDYGHAAGDAALQAFARILTLAMPANGAVGRWGGEEFLIVLPDTISATAQLIERLRQAALQIHLPFAPYLRIRFSAGIAARQGSEQILDEMIAAADRALYGAKREGRDTTRIAV